MPFLGRFIKLPSPPKKSPGREIILKDQEILFLEGAAWDGLYLVCSGRLEIYLERQGKKIILGHAGEGEFIGTPTLLSQAPRLASAKALGESSLIHYPLEITTAMLKSLPDWARAIFKDILNCLRHADRTLIHAHAEKEKLETVHPPLKKIVDLFVGMLWASNSRHCEVDGRAVEILPIGAIASWLEPVLDCPGKTIEQGISILEECGVIQIIQAPVFGTSLLNPDRVFLQLISTHLGHKLQMSPEKARELLTTPDLPAEPRAVALVSLLLAKLGNRPI